MTKDKSLHLTPKQLGLEDNPMIKDADPLASDKGEIEQPERTVTNKMIQAACVAGYGVDCDKDSNLYKVMKRALTAAFAV